MHNHRIKALKSRIRFFMKLLIINPRHTEWEAVYKAMVQAENEMKLLTLLNKVQ